MLPWSVTEFVHYPWYALPDLAGNLIAVIFVAASSTLFNTTGIEVAVHREADLERELNVAGIANMLSGAFGGYTGCISVSRSVLNFNAGGTGRLSAALTAAAISASMLACPGPARLHAEIRARRSPDLSRCGHAAQMDRAVAAPTLPDRISIAAGDHRHHPAMGFYRRHPDRGGDRLHDLCAERVAHRFHQVRLRRFRTPQLAEPLA